MRKCEDLRVLGKYGHRGPDSFAGWHEEFFKKHSIELESNIDRWPMC